MASQRPNLLYVYKERVPMNLRQLVLDSLPEDEFAIDKMNYELAEDQMREKMRWADMVLFAPGRYLPDDVIFEGRRVKLMQLWSSGYDKFNLKAASECGIPVANNGGANAIAVAEHAMLLLLAVAKRLPDSHRRTVDGKWAGNSHGMDMFSLYGKTLGIVGLGNIGMAMAERAAGFDMEIIYHDPVHRPETEKRLGIVHTDLDTLLSRSDVVSLHVHLNETTAGMIGNEQLARMKDSAVLINVSRAHLVDREALLEALDAGRLGGVGLDSHYEEPTQPGDPLLNHPCVVATPHIAGSTVDAYVWAMRNCVENFRRVRDGQKPKWVVNDVR